MATLPLAADAEADRPHSFLSAAETDLLARARAGDQRALRDFYGRYQQQVRGHLFRLLGRDPDLDDVVQTVFSRAFGALDGFKGNSALSTWLYRITANTTHNLLRQRFRRDRVRRAIARLKLSGDTEPGDSLEARNEVEGVLHRLHPDLREVFVLYHHEGLTLQEMSAVLERPISTIGDRLTRARLRLREIASGS